MSKRLTRSLRSLFSASIFSLVKRTAQRFSNSCASGFQNFAACLPTGVALIILSRWDFFPLPENSVTNPQRNIPARQGCNLPFGYPALTDNSRSETPCSGTNFRKFSHITIDTRSVFVSNGIQNFSSHSLSYSTVNAIRHWDKPSTSRREWEMVIDLRLIVNGN